MGKGGNRDEAVQNGAIQNVTWEEVAKHKTKESEWIVVEGKVYDVTNWLRKHPGGSKILQHYGGQDATEAFRAFHKDKEPVNKYMKALHIGEVRETQSIADRNANLKKDFEEMRKTVEKMGLFNSSPTFYILHFLHIALLEVAAVYIFRTYGTGWIPWLAALLCYSTVTSQAGWTQHDYGHISVFKNRKLNWFFHYLTMNFYKGGSVSWWQHMHNQHHAKPNMLNKDPDVRLEAAFVVGEEMPKKMAKKNKKMPPYNWQNYYFFIIGPPLLFPIYFQYMIFKHVIVRKDWFDLFIMLLFYFKFLFFFTPILGVFGMLKFYFIMRVVESHWFVWVSQSNHIPMTIEDDIGRPWLEMQMRATCNIEKSFLNDWFTGHLNFQIEHHCFPTMPRHNYYKAQPLVQSLCRKYDIPYVMKPISVAFSDIIRSLKNSGEIWAAYYEAYHHY